MHYCTNVSVKSKHVHPPRANPQAFLIIFENMRQMAVNAPQRGKKSVANPPTPGTAGLFG
jgi:hypothetical protein